MIIGIDLDNTIIDYRKAFWYTSVSMEIFSEEEAQSFSLKDGTVPNKNQIKHRLVNEEKNDFKWELLQGQVYGRYINNASIYPGVFNFLIHCKRRGVKVYIISHKTKFGHHDANQTSLRKEALLFLKHNNLFSEEYGINEKDIFFFDTRSEKVNKIAELNCSYFIDDLLEVFTEKSFPEKTKKILFDIDNNHLIKRTYSSWWKINSFVFKQTETADIGLYVENGLNKKVESVYKIKGRGNSSVYKIKMDSGKEFAGKLYPDPTFDERDRLEKESKACRYLHSNGINLVPELIWSDKNLNFSLFKWINGKEIVDITDDSINSAAEFINSLVMLSKNTDYIEFPLASAACLNGQMIEQQIRCRYAIISEYSDSNSELHYFLENDFIHVFETVLSNSKKLWPGKFEENLSNNYQLLSPSDFGFHNIFLTKNGLNFFDFEYFGWDDPVKLTCDFLLHPGMSISDKQKSIWIKLMKNIFSKDNSFSKRLRASYRLYGLCWCLIMLNVFTHRNRDKKVSEVNNIKLEKKQNHQLNKSKKMLIYLNEFHENTLLYE